MKTPRHIAIVGEDWSHILGTDKTKYMQRKVGLLLHGADTDRYQDMLRNMQIISGNVDLAMMPLAEIMGAIGENMRHYARLNPKYREANAVFQEAIRCVERAAELYDGARK